MKLGRKKVTLMGRHQVRGGWVLLISQGRVVYMPRGRVVGRSWESLWGKKGALGQFSEIDRQRSRLGQAEATGTGRVPAWPSDDDTAQGLQSLPPVSFPSKEFFGSLLPNLHLSMLQVRRYNL